jgi:hypothetical protein
MTGVVKGFLGPLERLATIGLRIVNLIAAPLALLGFDHIGDVTDMVSLQRDSTSFAVNFPSRVFIAHPSSELYRMYLLLNITFRFQIIPGNKGAFFTGCPVQICLPDLSHQLAIRHDLEGLPPNFHIFGDRFMDDNLKFIHRCGSQPPCSGLMSPAVSINILCPS